MNDLLRAALIATELVERRDRLRTIFGARYGEVTADARKLLSSISVRTGRPVLDVCRELMAKALDDGHGLASGLLIAAAVDLAEEAAR